MIATNDYTSSGPGVMIASETTEDMPATDPNELMLCPCTLPSDGDVLEFRLSKAKVSMVISTTRGEGPTHTAKTEAEYTSTKDTHVRSTSEQAILRTHSLEPRSGTR